MFSFVFQSLISSVGDEDVTPPSNAEEVIPSDAEVIRYVFQSLISMDCDKVIPSSDAKVMDNIQQENQVLGDLLRVTVQELCDCPKYTPVTVMTLCDCLSDLLHQCFFCISVSHFHGLRQGHTVI